NIPMVLHDLYEDVYYEVQFLSWSMSASGGGFSYTRSAGTTGWINVTGFDNGTFFEKADYADYTDSTNWDIVADSVAITRADSEGLFNPYTDTGFSHWTDAMPAGTEWAWGATEEDDQDYTSWYNAVYQSGWGPAYALESSMEGYTDGHTMSMHLIEEDLYYDVEFHDWTCCAGGGGFSYTRYQVSPDGISIENTLSANSSDTLTIILGGSSLSPGEYSAEMIIGTSDTDTPELVVDIDLTVIGTPVLVLSTDSLDYDSLFIGLESLQFVELLNSGNDLLTITSVSSNNSEFQVSLEDDSLDAMESTLLTVTYVPVTDGAISGQITIESNDLTNPTLTVQLTAVGQVPPEIELSVDSLEVFVSPEDSTTRYFTISNTGPNNLVYNISMDDIGSQTVTFTKEDWADWTLPENQDRVSDNLWITRGDYNALFNAIYEYPEDHPHGPEGTQWAVGPLEDIEMLWFDSFV
ncbi:uncharacterized protein METZ01_LOCUS241124, partial [marine metagenome]